MTPSTHSADRDRRIATLTALLGERILVLDGAYGTMIQRHELTDAQFRGERFADWAADIKGNNDLLNLTQPEVIRGIHTAYLEAGADIIETNTFSSTSVAMADYGMESLARELNVEGARLAREVADAVTAATGVPRFVAGALGPTNRTTSLSPDVSDPSARGITFDQLVAAYGEQIDGLLDGGVDLLLIETVFDTLNAKAAIFAALDRFDARGERVPLWISGTITDASGRTLSGQTTEAFWNSVAHAEPLIVGLNCALGAPALRPYVQELAHVSPTFVSTYPNAGLPNEFGEYDDTPEFMAKVLGEFARSGFLNVVGGCCGTTPDHIRAIAEAVRGVAPRVPEPRERRCRLAGLEPLTVARRSCSSTWASVPTSRARAGSRT